MTALPPPRAPSPPAPKTANAATKISRNEARLLQAAINESLQQPVDPRRLVSTKVCTTTMPLRVQPLTSRMAVVWPSPSSPPPGTRFVLTAIVQAQRPPPAIGIDICIPARGLSCVPLYGKTAIN